jgi:hypothetical protein
MEIRQAFVVGDQQFDSKAEAMDYLRRPKVMAALLKLTNGQSDLAELLYENRDTIESAFDTGMIRRVTKAERKKIRNAFEALPEVLPKAAEFLREKVTYQGAEVSIMEQLIDSFSWPKQRRMTDDEKTAALSESLKTLSISEEVAEWIKNVKDDLFEAYGAGVEKRTIPQKALDGLAAYRAKMAAIKAAEENT